jgi:hypothetical protein
MLATRYYGRSEQAMVIRAANGFVHPDDGSIAPGELVEPEQAEPARELAEHRVAHESRLHAWFGGCNVY